MSLPPPPWNSLLHTLLSPACLGFSTSKYPDITATVQCKVHCHSNALSQFPIKSIQGHSHPATGLTTRPVSLSFRVYGGISWPSLGVSLTLHHRQTLTFFVSQITLPVHVPTSAYHVSHLAFHPLLPSLHLSLCGWNLSLL